MTWILSRSKVACLPMCSLNHKCQCAFFIISGHQHGLSQGLEATALTREYTIPFNTFKLASILWEVIRKHRPQVFRMSTGAHSIKLTTFLKLLLNCCLLERKRGLESLEIGNEMVSVLWDIEAPHTLGGASYILFRYIDLAECGNVYPDTVTDDRVGRDKKTKIMSIIFPLFTNHSFLRDLYGMLLRDVYCVN